MLKVKHKETGSCACIMRIYYVADGLGGLMFVWGPCSPEEGQGGLHTHMDVPSYSVRLPLHSSAGEVSRGDILVVLCYH